jgi:hypothetical protein
MPSWDSRSSELSSRLYGLNPDFARAVVVDKCNVWFGDFDLDQDGTYEPLTDICDDWKPLGDPSPAGRLTAPELGDRAGGHVAVVERGKSDTSTVWAATSTGRVFISKNADKSTIYVGNDFGVVRKNKNQPTWHETGGGLPNVTVSDLVLVPERGVLYAGTHGQGVWQFKVH